MINILRIIFFIAAPLGLIFLIGFSDEESTDDLQLNYTLAGSHTNITAKEISKLKESAVFKDVNLFTYEGDASGDREISGFADGVSKLTINQNSLNRLFSEKPGAVNFNIPSVNGMVQLELSKVDILDKDFRVTVKNNGRIERSQYTHGVHYRGIIKGDGSSLASVSIFPDFVMGVVSNAEGNYNLGSVKDGDGNYTSNYIYYNDRDTKVKNEFECGVEGREEFFTNYKNVSNNMPLDNPTGGNDIVRVYFEADSEMYSDFGNNLNNVGQFIEGMFNNVVTIYNNESIPVNISEIRVITSAFSDPYIFLSQSDDILFAFGENTKDNFFGDLAHLLSTRNDNLGGIAWIRVLCVPYDSSFHAGRYAFSNIEPTYNPYPTHSWTVNVVAHEMGHNFGSMHTHACVWPVFFGGGIGAIDSCYFAEGNCFFGRRPRLNGTIMSYCHLGGSVSLSAGFGPLPGDTILLRYQQAGCIQNTTNSSEPTAFFLDQNFPNPFNPGTNIRFELPEEAIIYLTVYDISGREITKLVSGEFHNRGIFSYYFDAGRFSLASGVYFYRITAFNPANGTQNIYSQVKKMILIK